jgi:hypothetical protein
MRILVACEESQAVTKAFRAVGHEAFSCDVQECSGGRPEWHIRESIDAKRLEGWDMIIAFPPCVYLCGSGMHWTKRGLRDPELTERAAAFFMLFASAPCERIAIENPVGIMSTRWRKPNQYIQPWQFGHDASKKTGLWLKGLPLLKPTKIIPPRIVEGKKRWSNQTDSGQNKLAPSADRSKLRSKTYSGIAEAMAAQWGKPDAAFAGLPLFQESSRDGLTFTRTEDR